MGRDSGPQGRYAGPNSGGITGWRDGSGIGSGLARPGAGGSVLRREPSIEGSRTTNLLELIPRFLRLSALVAIELGNEASQEGVEDEHGSDNEQKEVDDMLPREPSSFGKQAQNRMDADALRPSTEWYMLLAGLLTRAIFEGYYTAGWRGTGAAECLLSCGLGVSHLSGKEEKSRGQQTDNHRQHNLPGYEGDKFAEFDPVELPNLEDAAKILFPASRSSPPQRREGTEAEYELEMHTRFRKVNISWAISCAHLTCLHIVLRRGYDDPRSAYALGGPRAAVSR
jgi:hypothetical protein